MRHHLQPRALTTVIALLILLPTTALATPEFVEHVAFNSVYGETSATMRDPVNPADGDPVDLWIRLGYSFYYDDVAIYYTTDGSEPQGAGGVGSGATQVLTFTGGDIAFVRNEPHSPDNIDWWRATLPGGVITNGATIKYKISAWHSGGGAEVFANNYGCADNTCDDPAAPQTVFEFTVGGSTGSLPWPGKGAPYADHTIGYPAVSHWKEEGVVGNNFMNVQIDQNGTIYDVYYPSAGCVRGVGTKNEGYVDGLDTFPPGLPLGYRGQMNVNQAMPGLRVDGVTYWLSNEQGAGYDQVSQAYVPAQNVIYTSGRLYANGNDIDVEQWDFCPKGITYPTDQGGNPNRGIYLKTLLITNNNLAATTMQFYFYADFALNGGDAFDGMFYDATRGAMVAYDTTDRWADDVGEYNPTTTGNYRKNVSVYLAAAFKALDSVGGTTGSMASESWRTLGSVDNDQGWIGIELTIPAGGTKQVDVIIAGGFDDFPNATGTYDYQIAPVIDWFYNTNVDGLLNDTQTYWTNWLAEGVTVDTPDDEIDEVFERGLLATALHLDGKNGGIIAGMHNGAYPFVWPRDAAWAAITLARAGHVDDASEIYRFLRDIAYRDVEGWGRKGFWKQKYTTDGHTVWSSPQVDETSCYPWGIKYLYDVTGDLGLLQDHYDEVYDAAIASSQDSTVDNRLYYDETFDLVYSNNLWEDSWDLFIYSNASVIRGLEDAAAIANILDQQVCPGGPGTCGYHNDAALFTTRANAIRGGVDARLDWNGENTDISLLGITYPFETYPPGHPRVELCMDRINGVAADKDGNYEPLTNVGGEWDGLVNRYWGDTYWHNSSGPNPNASPWFLTTLWYGAYYAVRQDVNPGTSDIDNHLYRLEQTINELGPIGLGAEQMAPSNSLLYPGQTDFVLQTAWPNAWESMSFLVDAVMLFLDYTPDAPGNTLRIEPKLPIAWDDMTFHNLRVGPHRIDVTVARSATTETHTFTNRTGNAVDFDTHLRTWDGCGAISVTIDGAPAAYTYDPATGRVHVTGPLNTGLDAVTTVQVDLCSPGDVDCDCHVALNDLELMDGCMSGPDLPNPGCDPDQFNRSDLNADLDVDLSDIAEWQTLYTG